VSNNIFHNIRTALNSSDNVNNSGEDTQAMPFAADEHSGFEPETPSSTRSSTPLLSDESNGNVQESEKEDETENDNDLSGKRDEQDNDNDNSPVQVFNGDNITTTEPIDHHPVPPTKPTAAAAVRNPPTRQTMVNIKTRHIY
jgi:hypothetical protein